jgi:CheY-like chemotaxis protein
MNRLTNCRIALADDDADDQALFDQALKQVNKDAELTIFNDGQELMQSLLQENAVLPDIVFLDLSMPKKGGIECLEEIRGHKLLKGLPVVILTTSANQEDIKRAYDNNACLFFNKPDNHTVLISIIKKVLSVNLEPWNPIMF